jgi:hypothetical protein
MTSANTLRPLKFYTLVGFAGVRIEGDGVVGNWDLNPKKLWGSSDARLVQDFVNWRSEPEAILKFAKQFGPIWGFRKPGREFGYSFSGWKRRQDMVRTLWRGAGSAGTVIPPDHGALVYEDGRLVLAPYTLFTFLCMELATCPSARLRICDVPGCPTPYFVARHDLRTKFCSTACAGTRQREWKRIWWKENGRKRRLKSATRRTRRKR